MAVSHKGAVYKHFKRRLCRPEMNEYFAFFPRVVKSKGFAIEADFLHFMIYRRNFVLASADSARKCACIVIRHGIAFRLPNRGNRDIIPFLIVKFRLFKILRLIFKAALPIKFPFAVKRFFVFAFFTRDCGINIVKRHGDNMPVFLIDFNNLGIFP